MEFYAKWLVEVITPWWLGLITIVKLLFFDMWWAWLIVFLMGSVVGTIYFLLELKTKRQRDKNVFFVENITTA